MDNQINISLPEGFNQQNFEVIQTEGLQVRPISDVKIEGDLRSPFIYCENLRRQNNGHGSYFLISREKLSITLNFEPQNYYKVQVIGRLKPNKRFTKLEINGTGSYSKDELVKTFQKYAAFFSQPGDLEKVLNYFEKWSGSFTFTKSDEKSTKNGSYNLATKKDVNIADMPKFTLTMPLFEGEPEHIFEVEILVEMSESSVKFWLISPELEKNYDLICINKLDEMVIAYRNKDAFKGISFIWE